MTKQQDQTRGRSNKVMIFSCALGIVAAMISGVMINNATAQSRFEKEIVAVNEAFSAGDRQKISEVLDRTVSSGDYAKVEKSIKKYVGDIMKNINDIEEIAESEAVYNSLEGKYLEKNRDKLEATISELDKASKKIEALTSDYKKLYSEESVKGYIEGQDLSDSYSALFSENAKLFYDDKDLHNDYDSMLKVVAATIRVEAKAIDYLNKNKSAWKIVDGSISFTSSDVAAKYNDILQSVANS